MKLHTLSSGAWLVALGWLATSAEAQIEVKRSPPPGQKPGYPIKSQAVITNCQACHKLDSGGRMTRISYLRKTPEGWETTVRRMVTYNGVRMAPEAAREIVRYLATNQGLAPEELMPGRFEVERRLVDYRYTADTAIENTCRMCHSMGRVITQRRTGEEWGLLMNMHRGMLNNEWTFGETTPPGFGGMPGSQPPGLRAISHFSATQPLETPEWRAWSATMRTPKMVGSWAVAGHELGKGDFYGRVVIAQDPEGADRFTTTATYTYVKSGRKVTRSGRSIVYTGYQWRGRSHEGRDTSEAATLREVMMVSRDWRAMDGRWFNGGYDEMGVDVKLFRVGAEPVVSGVFPAALKAGTEEQVRLYGANLPQKLAAGDIDLGEGVTVLGVSRVRGDSAVLRVRVDASAPSGRRDIFVKGVQRADAFAVYKRIDRVHVIPEAGLSRIGGGPHPKMFAQFEAHGYDNGPDDRPGTVDDINIGPIDVTWTLDEYPATFDDDDLQFVGELDKNGFFTPAMEGPNPQRRGSRNNIGDVWVLATYDPKDGRKALRGRAHLLVTVPLYIRWEPWRPVGK
jgi:quinohemoprotein amine dehydrogenase